MSEERPLITFMLVAYKQERFIAEAVRGAFSQTYAPLEFILSDDCSPDRTFEIMQEMASQYQGPHRVVLNRNEDNSGLGSHINKLMQMARGELIVAAAGDDVSLPHRTERLWQEFEATEHKAYSLFSNEYLIDEQGTRRVLGRQAPPDPERLTLNWFVHHQASVTGSSQAWRRDVFDFFGPLNDRVVSEDVVIPFRALLLGSICYIHEPLVLRRYTGENLSLGSFSKWNPHTTTRQFHDRSIRHARNFQAVYETWLKDIGNYGQVHPEQHDELDVVQSVIENKLFRVQSEVRFWKSSHSEKPRILLRDFIKNGFRKTAARLLLSWMFPQFFLRWQHYVSLSQRGTIPEVEMPIASVE